MSKATAWLIAALLAFVVQSAFAGSYSVQSLPDPKAGDGGYVSNPDQILTSDTVARLNAMLKQLEHQTGAQIAVVAVESIEGGDVFAFSQGVFDRWRIGRVNRNDGALVVLARQQRTVRIHTGYGLEGLLPDAICKRITSELMTPLFKEGRFDEGVLKGVAAVVRIVEQGDSSAGIADLHPEKSVAWQFFFWATGCVWSALGIVVWMWKFMNEEFSEPKAKLNGELPRMKWYVWFGVYLGAPLLILQLFNNVRVAQPMLATVLCVYVYLLGAMAIKTFVVWRKAEYLFKERRFQAIHTLMGHWRSFGLFVAVFFPLPMLVVYFRMRRLSAQYRQRVRSCTKCDGAMRRLDEGADDAHLSKVQLIEEKLNSVDYDIWECTKCQAIRCLAFPTRGTEYEKCPKCKGLTYLLEEDEVLSAATYEQAGSGRRRYACKACNESRTQDYAIRRLTTSSSSGGGSSSSSSSGSSSNWGGGSSGGGGASSSW